MIDRVRARPDRIVWLVVATTVFAAVLRYSGIFWGLPLTLHADEWVIVEYAIDMAHRNSFEPAFYARPDHLEIQLSYIAYQAWGHLFNGAPPEVLFESSPGPFYAISRAITATFGTAMIPVAYWIGRVFARPAGLLMAVAVAIFPPFVEHSRYATPDIPLTLTVMLVILGCALYLRTQGWWPLVLACVGVALGITVKYPAVVGTVMIAVAIIVASLRGGRPWWILSRGSAAIGLVVGTTFFLSPVLFTNAPEVLRQLTAQNSDGHLGASGLGFAGNLTFYSEQTLLNGGILFALFAVAGVAWIIVARRWDAIPLGIGVVFWVVISSLSLHWERWGLPMYISVVLLAGVGVYAAWRSAPRWRLRGRLTRLPRALILTLAVLSGMSLLAGSAVHAIYALLPDTRAVAGQWLADNDVAQDDLIYDGYTPFHPDGPASIATWLEVENGEVRLRDPKWTEQYVLTSSSMSGRYIASDEYPEEREVYMTVADTLPVVETWHATAPPVSGMWEISRIAAAIDYAERATSGALSGPQLVLYELPR